MMWFAFKSKLDLIGEIYVLFTEKIVRKCVHFKKGHSLPYHTFPCENITTGFSISLVSKKTLVNEIVYSKSVRHYQPNLNVNQIQKPSIAEIVRIFGL